MAETEKNISMESNKMDSDLNSMMQNKLKELLEDLHNIAHADSNIDRKKIKKPNIIIEQEQTKVMEMHGRTVKDDLATLSLLPEWLNSFQHSIDEFLKIAKSLQPVVTKDFRGETPFNQETYPNKLLTYKKLVSEKKSRLEVQRDEESKQVVIDLIDLSIASAEAFQLNKGDVPNKLMAESILMFTKALPIQDIVESLEDLLDEDLLKKMPAEHLHLEVQRQYTLNEEKVQEYLKAQSSDNILGHVVHRLLGVKYPRPPPPPGMDLPWLPVMALLLGLNDADTMSTLQNMLKTKQVQLVFLEDALESCIESYRKEGPGLPLLESRNPPPSTETPLLVTSVERLLPHVPYGDKVELQQANAQTHEKETQTGSDIVPVLSLGASLGKQALETLRLQEEISDWLLVAMVIEHLKLLSTTIVTGWVLVDFPKTYNQAILFENAISGLLVPNPDKKEADENLSKVTLHQSRIVCDPSVPSGEGEPFRTVFTSVVSVLEPEPPQDAALLDHVSLIQELYLQQGVHYCLHCSKWSVENTTALVELITAPSPISSSCLKKKKQQDTVSCTIGQSGWEYVDIDIAGELCFGLASVWESLEIAYITSLHRVFLALRAQSKRLDKYIKGVQNYFTNYLSRPDIIEDLLSEFQDRHHELPVCSLGDVYVKVELHDRVESLKRDICEAVKTRHEEADEELQRIGGEPWLGRELVVRLNTTSSVVQLELDRCIDTLALLQDYFCAMLLKPPPDTSKSLRFDVLRAPSAEVSDEVGVYMVECLESKIKPEITPPSSFIKYLDVMQQGAHAHLNKMMTSMRSSISKLESEFKPKPALSRKKDAAKKTKGKKKGLDISDVTPLENLEEARLTSCRLQLLREWCLACEKELERTTLRIQEACIIAQTEAREFINKLWHNSFLVVKAASKAQFNSDRHSAITTCEFLHMAIESEASLDAPLMFTHKNAHLQLLKSSHSLDELNLTPKDTTLPEKLRALLDIFHRLAPDGIISSPALVYILHQAITSSSQGCLLPLEWKNLDLKMLTQLVQNFVSETNYLDWRTFLLRLLNLPLASQTQLLIARAQLMQADLGGRGKITREKFSLIKLWIEEAFEEEMEAKIVKDLLFDLYRTTSRDSMKYLDFLVACCQDKNPSLGFAKACSIYLGHLINTGYKVEEEKDFVMDLVLTEIGENFPLKNEITLETAISALATGRPSNGKQCEDLRNILKEVFMEVEEQSLSPQQRRTRKRQVVANRGNPPVEKPLVFEVQASFLLKHPTIVNLATPFYEYISIGSLVKQLIGCQNFEFMNDA